MALSAFAKALRATFAVEPRLFEGLGSTRRCFGHLLHQRPALSGFSAGRNSSNTAADLQSNEEHPRPSGETPPPPGSTAEGLGLEREWTPQSRRTGVIAVKLGMTQLWNKEGFPMAVTVLQVVDNQVVLVRTIEREGYTAVQVGGIDHPKIKRMLKPVLGQFEKAGVTPKRKLSEFRVTEDALLPVGTHLNAAHFVPGQYVDVQSTSIGKGFQGVMKRHGMKGQPASHGQTKTHRKMGGTGGGQDPGRIWPGKRMPGRMGGKTVTMKSLKVYRINHRFNVLYVNGCVPGHKNTFVRITDAKRKPHVTPPPFPTHFPDPGSPQTEESYSDDIHLPHEPTLFFPDKTQEKRRRR